MAAPKTVLTYPLDGSNRDFTIPFEYLARKFVVVTLVGKTRQVLVPTSEYRFATKTTITTTKAWGPGDGFESVEIRRITSATERLVDFSDGSILRAYDLNTAQVQSLHIAEEARDLTADTIAVNNDGDLDARGKKIVNLGDAVLPGDAVTLRQEQQWAGSALNQAIIATSEATKAGNYANGANASLQAAVVSQSAAKASETNAKASETNSYNNWQLAASNANSADASATRAANSAVAAKASETNAKASEVNALTQADRAKVEADKLGNMNGFAATLNYVVNPTISYKRGWIQNIDGINCDVIGSRTGVLTLSAFTLSIPSGNVTVDGGSIYTAGAITASGPGSRLSQGFYLGPAPSEDVELRGSGDIKSPLYYGGSLATELKNRADRIGSLEKVYDTGWMKRTVGLTTYHTHGLGRMPDIFVVHIRCVVPDSGYSVGDVIALPVGLDWGGAVASYGVVCRAYDNTVFNIYTGQGMCAQTINKTDNAIIGISYANWELRVKARLM
jgi:hypothetical protein